MRNRDLISGLFLILVSLGTCIMAYRLGLGTGGNPGAGFAAFGIAFLLGLMSVYLFLKGLVQAVRGHKETGAVNGRLRWKKPMLILFVLTGYGIFFNFLGFPLSTFLLMMLLVWIMGRQKLWLALTVAFLTVASAYAFFVVLLGLPLPMGSLWYLFGE